MTKGFHKSVISCTAPSSLVDTGSAPALSQPIHLARPRPPIRVRLPPTAVSHLPTPFSSPHLPFATRARLRGPDTGPFSDSTSTASQGVTYGRRDNRKTGL